MSDTSLLPIIGVELIGAALVIFAASCALGYARALVQGQPENFIWSFLWVFSLALAAFAISREIGHVVRILLVYSDNQRIWNKISLFSGGFNTILLISGAAATLYYHKGLEAYKAVRNKAEKLAEANLMLQANAKELRELNTNLEDLVSKRTQALSFSENKFRTFFENSKDIVYFTDVSGNITDMNASGLTLLGNPSLRQPMNCHQLFASQEDLKSYFHSMKTKGYVSDLEMECRCFDGTIRHILLSGNARYDSQGKLIGYQGIGKDMTRLRIITDRLINHEKLASVGKMAAGIAHEINTPLGIILGYIQLMLEDTAQDSEEQETLQIIERQGQICRRIVTDLLKFSRQTQSIKTPIDINKIIQEVLTVIEHNLHINKVQVVRYFGRQLPKIIGDAEKLYQVFHNLFSNAQQAMENGGTITVTTSSDDAHLSIEISDTGAGISETIKDKIFDPFFTTKNVGEGTGLGLSVSYGIIEEHHGKIVVTSPVPGKNCGTSFHITLPLSATPTDTISKEE